jgi:hypothetical protein
LAVSANIESRSVINSPLWRNSKLKPEKGGTMDETRFRRRALVANYRTRCHSSSQARRISPAMSEITKRMIATQNKSFAAPTAVPATPPKPNNAATTATTRNTTA